MIEEPDTFALSYVLKFRHAMALTQAHAITAAAITINALHLHTINFEPDNPRRKFYMQALEHLVKMYEDFEQREMQQLKNQ